MNLQELITMDVDRLRRLDAGEVVVVDQGEDQAKYQIVLRSTDVREIARVTGLVQTIFGPRLLSSGSHEDPDGNKIDARVDLSTTGYTENQPEATSITVTSFTKRARFKC